MSDADRIQVWDDVMKHPEAYRAWALGHEFKPVQAGPDVFKGIAVCAPEPLLYVVQQHYPEVTSRGSFFRQSPEGQLEPNFVHTDFGMGDASALLYLTPTPPREDGTAFWRDKESGAIAGTDVSEEARSRWRAPSRWECWHRVEAKFNRLLVFPAEYFHSRTMEQNYGSGPDSRLIQMLFLQGQLKREVESAAVPVAKQSTIREAVYADLPAILRLGQQFRDQSVYRAILGQVKAEAVGAACKAIFASPDQTIFVAEVNGAVVGLFAVIVAPHPFTGERMGTELVWYMAPAHRGLGLKLLRSAESWAKAHGAVAMQLGAPSTSLDVQHVYERLHYVEIERLFHRVL